MRIKSCLLIMAMALVFASCGKDPEPSPIKSFSVLGDSFSAYEGTVYPETNDVWCYDRIGFTGVEQMWWYQVASSTGWVLDRNNSFSGSLISNFRDYNAGPYYSPHSFIRRMDELGNPDVIFVFGGTNDVWNSASSGDFVYSDWTEDQLETYRPALAYLFDNLKQLYPNAEVYFLIDMSLYDYESEGQRFVNSVHTIATQYQIECIDLYDVHKDWKHPDIQGQEDIATQVIEAISGEVNA